MRDILRRFILEKANVRGEWVQLEHSWHQLLERADYPPVVRKVLGEALSAAVLLSATVKHTGSLILQIRGDGPVHLLVVHATPQGEVRGLAQWTSVPEEGSNLSTIFGTGHIAITLEAASNHERYQGIIALEGDNLTQALEQYFARSEQLPTRLWLTSDHNTCAGLLLQRLPSDKYASTEQIDAQAEDWNRVSLLLDTLTTEELRDLSAEDLIYRLFHEETPRLFDPKSIKFHCHCSRQKIETMLRSLGQDEVQAIIAEQGHISVTCEFCNANYSVDAVDAARLFTENVVDLANTTVH
ncbi:MAG: Hsp33 family molecular chaperone HslO [Thiothrix sp.]|nr:MAG: Hsp33 family molecular chaperone HslO [Thiothrix sp.]